MKPLHLGREFFLYMVNPNYNDWLRHEWVTLQVKPRTTIPVNLSLLPLPRKLVVQMLITLCPNPMFWWWLHSAFLRNRLTLKDTLRLFEVSFLSKASDAVLVSPAISARSGTCICQEDRPPESLVGLSCPTNNSFVIQFYHSSLHA